MRKIKFRGQDVFTKEWAYGYFSECVEPMDEPVCLSCITDIENNSWVVYPETVGQYIGKKDKNNIEIYEGDIGVDKGFRYPLQVVFDENDCAYGMASLGNLVSYGISDTFSVIGNIYKNPELSL